MPKMDKNFNLGRALELCVELPKIQDQLSRAGLYETASLVNTAVQRIGYEVAELREKAKRS